MIDWLTEAVNNAINYIGYYNFIRIKDLIVFLSGLSMGCIALAILGSTFIRRVSKVETLEKTIMVKFEKDGEPAYFANPQNNKEAIHIGLLLFLSPIFKIKTYTTRDMRRTNRFLIIITIIMILIVITAILLMCTTILPNENGAYDLHILDFLYLA